MNNRISIITAVYNGKQLLPKLIESVKQQSYANKELIIIDGNSTDGTVDVIKEYENDIEYWISEPDQGIYDAWNKGIVKATGDWIIFLGCDDELVSGALDMFDNFLSSIHNKDKIDIIPSKAKKIDASGKTIRITGWQFQWPLFLKEMTIEHGATLHSKNLFTNYGLFNTTYKIVGDYELLLRPGRKLRSVFMDKVTVVITEGGVSESIRAIDEHYRAVTTTGKYPIYKALTNALIVLSKFKMKKLARKMGFNIYLKKI